MLPSGELLKLFSTRKLSLSDFWFLTFNSRSLLALSGRGRQPVRPVSSSGWVADGCEAFLADGAPTLRQSFRTQSAVLLSTLLAISHTRTLSYCTRKENILFCVRCKKHMFWGADRPARRREGLIPGKLFRPWNIPLILATSRAKNGSPPNLTPSPSS